MSVIPESSTSLSYREAMSIRRIFQHVGSILQQITHGTIVCARYLVRTNYRSVSVPVITIPQTHVLRICMTLQKFEKLLDLGSCSYWRSRRYSSTLIVPPI
jgi:hypothetical protein